jgi:hypothetical protein
MQQHHTWIRQLRRIKRAASRHGLSASEVLRLERDISASFNQAIAEGASPETVQVALTSDGQRSVRFYMFTVDDPAALAPSSSAIH